MGFQRGVDWSQGSRAFLFLGPARSGRGNVPEELLVVYMKNLLQGDQIADKDISPAHFDEGKGAAAQIEARFVFAVRRAICVGTCACEIAVL